MLENGGSTNLFHQSRNPDETCNTCVDAALYFNCKQ